MQRHPSHPTRHLPIVVLCLATALVACGEDEGAVVDDAPLTSVVGAESTGGLFTVKIDDATPDPPIRGEGNAWVFTVSLDGAPMSGCSVEVEPTMPLHGHGTNPDPTVTDMGEGRYEMRPVNFIMPGEWHVAIRPNCDGATDEIVLVVDIQS